MEIMPSVCLNNLNLGTIVRANMYKNDGGIHFSALNPRTRLRIESNDSHPTIKMLETAAGRSDGLYANYIGSLVLPCAFDETNLDNLDIREGMLVPDSRIIIEHQQKWHVLPGIVRDVIIDKVPRRVIL
ncbi:MAG: hypothetical protein NVSMB46_00150 [Candidatus Saccharimonadales bacterium]